MTVQSGQSITILFTTRVFATGVGTNADSLPTGTLYKNGAANGATVTITNISTGLYKAAVTLPTLAVADEVEIAIAATVSSISDTAIIWGDTNDMVVNASGDVQANSVQINGVSASSVTTVNAVIGQANTIATDSSGDVTFNNTSIATVTNLTNAPTSGDFTTTMKTSIGTAVAASAVASVTGNVGGSVASVVAPVGITSNRKKDVTATFVFPMFNSSTNTPQTGLTVASVISKDTGSFVSTANSVTEIGDGFYYITLQSAEMNANNIALEMSATGANDQLISIQTQP